MNWSSTPTEEAGGVTGRIRSISEMRIPISSTTTSPLPCPFLFNHKPATRDRTAIIPISEVNELTPRP